MKTKKLYQCRSKISEMVCRHLGWIYEINAIETFKRGSTVYVRGTALKPDEWLSLRYKLTYFHKIKIDGKEYFLKLMDMPLEFGNWDAEEVRNRNLPEYKAADNENEFENDTTSYHYWNTKLLTP